MGIISDANIELKQIIFSTSLQTWKNGIDRCRFISSLCHNTNNKTRQKLLPGAVKLTNGPKCVAVILKLDEGETTDFDFDHQDTSETTERGRKLNFMIKFRHKWQGNECRTYLRISWQFRFWEVLFTSFVASNLWHTWYSQYPLCKNGLQTIIVEKQP